MSKNIQSLLDKASVEYYNGTPIMSDDEFDALVDKFGYDKVGASAPASNKVTHRYQMYSLLKVVDNEKRPISGDIVESPKLDGAAISLLYSNGKLIKAATRGDGITGEDITDKCYLVKSIPNSLAIPGEIQVVGEIVAYKTIPNSRNYCSGALHLKDNEEFKTRLSDISFIAYGTQPYVTETYKETLTLLKNEGFRVVTDIGLEDLYPTDGKVFRLNSNAAYTQAGLTARHPKGAYALKLSKDVETKQTKLLDVIWQTGKSGKVTPVAIFEPIIIEGATLQRATLNNVGFIEEMELEIGDNILVTRSGGIIPKILGKV
jgi:NAD-dependent DNA ligase